MDVLEHGAHGRIHCSLGLLHLGDRGALAATEDSVPDSASPWYGATFTEGTAPLDGADSLLWSIEALLPRLQGSGQHQPLYRALPLAQVRAS